MAVPNKIDKTNVSNITKEDLNKLRTDGDVENLKRIEVLLEEIGPGYENLNAQQKELYNTAKKYRQELERTNVELEKGGNLMQKIASKANDLNRRIGDLANVFKAPLEAMDRLGGAWGKADQAANDFGKRIGLNTKAVAQLRDESIKFANDVHIGAKYNASIKDMIELQQKYASSVGRNLQLTNKQRETLLATSRVMGENTVDFARKLENLGIGLERSGSLAAKMYNEAAKSGISFEKTSKYVTENLTKVQNYGFKNGVEGLTAMAKRAAEVNLNIAEAFKVADKIQTGGVQEAIKMGAGLQVLGGNFASFGDPMGMLYQGINDVEGLQERMIKMFTGYGGIKNGEFKISGANRLLVNQAAQTMGVDANEMYNMISRQAVRDRVEKQMGSRFNGDEELKQLLLNTATLNKDNQAVVNIRGEEKKLSEVTDADKKYLQDLQKTESEDIKDIAQILRGYTDVQQGFTKEIENKKAQAFSNIGKATKMIYDKLGQSNVALEIIKDAVLAQTLLSAASSITGGIGNAFGRAGGRGGFGGGVGRRGSVRLGGTPTGGGTLTTNYNIGGKTVTSYGETNIPKSVLRNKRYTNIVSEGDTILAETKSGKIVNAGKLAKVGKAAGGAALGGVAGGAFAALGYLADGSFKGSQSDKAKAGYGIAGAAVGGALGSLLTPFIGPLGTIIGGELGKWGGEALGKAINKGRANKKKELTNELKGVNGKNGENVSDAFASLSDNYSRSQLKKIKNALKDGVIAEGELNGHIMRKLAKSGDKDLIEKFGSREAKAKINKEIEKLNARIDKGNFNMDTGEFSIGNANFGMIEPVAMARGGKLEGPSDINGPGMPIQGSNIVVGGGEYVVNAEATKRNESLLNRINSGETIRMSDGGIVPKIRNITPSLVKNPMIPLSVRAISGAMEMAGGTRGGAGKLEVSPIKLDVSGTIKLDSNGKQVDLDAIINNPAFINQLSQMIERRLSDNINGGNFKEMRKNKQHTF